MSIADMFAVDSAETEAGRFELDYLPEKLQRPRHWSPSQVKTFKRCERAWWFEKVAGLRSPGSPATKLGSRVHAVLEAHMLGDELPDDPEAARIAKQGLKHLPPERPHADDPEDLFIEFRVSKSVLDVDGFGVLGYVDVLDWRGRPEKPLVLDHKTASSFTYVLDERQLAVDVQMITYGEAALRLGESVLGHRPAEVELAHVVYITKGSGDRRTSIVLDEEQVAAAFKEIVEPSVREMRARATAKHPTEVEPTWSACGDYGGCAHRERCQALRRFYSGDMDMAAKERMKARLLAKQQGGENKGDEKPPKQPANDGMTAAQRMKARLANKGGKVNPPDANTAKDQPDPEPPKPAKTGKARRPPGWAKKLEALGWDADEHGFKTWDAAKVRSTIESKRTPDMGPPEPEKTDKPAVSGPDALRLQSLGYKPNQIERMTAATASELIEQGIGAAGVSILPDGTYIEIAPDVRASAPKTLADFEPGSVVVVGDDVIVTVVEHLSRNRTDIEGESGKPDTIPSTTPAELYVEPEPEPEPVDETEVEPAVDDASYPGPLGLVLAIDCAVGAAFKGNVITLPELIAPFCRMVEREEKFENGAALPPGGWHLLPYKRGERCVATLLSAALNEDGGVPGFDVVLVDSAHPATGYVLDTLLPYADLVLRGTR